MKICVTIDGLRFCFLIPYPELPLHFPKIPEPPEPPYAYLLSDVMLIASLQSLVHKASPGPVREALHAGVGAAIKAVQNLAPENVQVHIEATERDVEVTAAK